MDAPGNDEKWVRGRGVRKPLPRGQRLRCLYLQHQTHHLHSQTAIAPLTQPDDPAITGVVEGRQGRGAGYGGARVTRYPNMDAPGNDVTWVQGVATVDECENICLESPACVAYTYNIKHTTCIPKTAIGPLTQDVDPAITGVVERQGRSVVLQGLSVQEAKASFDCVKARFAEDRACASQTISRLDGELANLLFLRAFGVSLV
jgi:hypothetical protein